MASAVPPLALFRGFAQRRARNPRPSTSLLRWPSAVFKTWMLATGASMTNWNDVVAMGSRLVACPGMTGVAPALTAQWRRRFRRSPSFRDLAKRRARNAEAQYMNARLPVMVGLVPTIHVFASLNGRRVQDMDARHKGEHDDLERRRGDGVETRSLPRNDGCGSGAHRSMASAVPPLALFRGFAQRRARNP